MLSVQDASQGAGQMRPVNSGKLLVECRRVRRRAPLVAIDQIVPVGDQIVDRATLMTKGNAAIHAARRLLFHFGIRQRMDEFLVVLQTRFRLFIAAVLTFDFQKAGDVSHVLYSAATALARSVFMSDSALA